MDLSAERREIFASQRARPNIMSQAGQGILEYILVLVVIVLIALGVVSQFNSSFASFLNNYFGEYLACLIETGELPSLGGEDGVSQGECDAGFDKFTAGAGRPAITGGGDGSSSPKASARNSRPARYNSGRSTPSGEGGTSFARGNRPAQQNLSAGRGGRRDVGNAKSSESVIIRRQRRGTSRANIINDKFIKKSTKPKKDKVTKFKQPPEEKKKGDLRSRKIIFDPDDHKKKRDNPDLTLGSFSFAAFLKMMVIIAILIAILIFVGGQAMQIKKSWQKGD